MELVRLFTPSGGEYAVFPTPILHSNTMTGDFGAWIQTDGARNGAHISDANIDRLIAAERLSSTRPRGGSW